VVGAVNSLAAKIRMLPLGGGVNKAHPAPLWQALTAVAILAADRARLLGRGVARELVDHAVETLVREVNQRLRRESKEELVSGHRQARGLSPAA